MTTSGFDEVRLPEDIEKGAVGGPGFKTTILTLGNGYEKRNIDWSLSRATYDISYGISELADLRAVISFFYARRGRARGFRFKDWADYQLTGQELEVDADDDTRYDLRKTYVDDGDNPFHRPITKPVEDTLTVYVDGIESAPSAYEIDYDTGIITFDSAPGEEAVVTVDCEFDVPVRFDTDKLNLSVATFDAAEIPEIQLIELRVNTTLSDELSGGGGAGAGGGEG